MLMEELKSALTLMQFGKAKHLVSNNDSRQLFRSMQLQLISAKIDAVYHKLQMSIC